jgi:tetratricopeptide (TPR) repeat protein
VKGFPRRLLQQLMVVWTAALVCLPVQGAERVSPEVASRVLTILERSEDDPDAALEDLAKLAARARSDADLSFVQTERAAMLIQQDQLDVARVEMARVLDDRPPEFAPRLRNLYATTLLSVEDYAGALTQLEYWSRHSENPRPHGLFLMGYACVQLERFDEAIVALERAVGSDYPTRDPWIELLAYAYAQAGRPEDALELFETLVAGHPERARWWKQLGGILMLMDRVPEGTAGLAVAQTVEPMSFADQKRLARLYAHLGMPADGAELLARALSARENAAEGEAPGFEDLMLLGELWMRARETDEAIAVFEAAQAIADQGEAAMMIGQLYAQREDYESARRALEVSADAYGNEAPARLYYLLAVIQINLGNLKEADTALSRLAADEKYRERAANLSAYLTEAMGSG